ncbi:MAG: hypothetical protein A4E62_02973 [Syntrophorhabdus sp. PtaU1.Bin002]|nr:MAG: hypothetical protein A4E62_02973 [Syntrophorhabdus sp. PtaU1.Bin002]
MVKVAKDARVVYDITELFFCTMSFVLIEAVYSCDGLEQRMLLQGRAQVHYRVARSIKSGNELLDYDKDLRVVTIEKLVDDLFHVFFFGAVTLHHLLPELDHLFFWFLVNLFVAFPFVRRRYDYLGRDESQFVEEFMILESRHLVLCHQLCLIRGTLPGRAVVFADIEGPHINDSFRFVQHFRAGVLSFQISLLFVCQPLRVAFKPEVDNILVLCHIHVAALIQKGHNLLVFHCLLH